MRLGFVLGINLYSQQTMKTGIEEDLKSSAQKKMEGSNRTKDVTSNLHYRAPSSWPLQRDLPHSPRNANMALDQTDCT